MIQNDSFSKGQFFPPIWGVKFVEKLGFPNIFGSGKKPIKGFLVICFFLIKKDTKIPYLFLEKLGSKSKSGDLEERPYY